MHPHTHTHETRENTFVLHVIHHVPRIECMHTPRRFWFRECLVLYTSIYK